MVLSTEWAQVEVIDLINDGSGLAFGIIGGRSTGVVVKTILPGGVADRDGRLQSGDHILQIGEVNLRGLGSEQVASVLRQCGVHVRMVVARPVETATTDIEALENQAPIVPTKILGDPVELDRHLEDNGYARTCAPLPQVPYNPYIYGPANAISDIVDVVRNPLPIGKVPIPKICPPPPPLSPLLTPSDDTDLPETETFTIEIQKDDLGLGITVAGYVCEQEEISGIFVKSISKGGPVDAKGIIKVNDRIIEVNGTSVIGYTNHQAVEFLKNTGPLVKIKCERYLRGPKFEQLQQAIKKNELKAPSPPSPTVTSLPKIPLSMVHMSYLGIEPEGESRTSIDFDSTILFECASPKDEEKEIVIDGGKSLNFTIDSYDSIYEKWKDRVDKKAQLVIAQMHKTDKSGLGISLEGTVDVEDGKEVRPHHYIRNILPDGPVGLSGILQSGDELLEVNGIQLLGLNHLNVVSILKQLPTFVSLACARYPVPIRIIDTSQHPEAFQARKILAGSLQTLINSDQIRLVKAKSESSINSSPTSEALTTSRSRSLELIAGLPMWSEDPTFVDLNKGEHGLGFSILDYQDPLNPQETVIVIRSLVPGGVAQSDGRLIPGDRLLSVNDIDLSHASLDHAVQVLKGAAKGLVRIVVAKPINGEGSQETEDDHTCLEDFQECIEEFQEDLMSVPIFIEDDHSFNHSPSTSQVEDFGQKNINHITQDLENNYLNIRNSNGDSDVDISFKSTNDNCPEQKRDFDKEGYETCNSSENVNVYRRNNTPTNTYLNINQSSAKSSSFVDFFPANAKQDEFFLVQLCESAADHKLTYKLQEYYNDYDSCVDAYKHIAFEKIRTEMSDSEIFSDILLPFKCRSAPNVMDRSFVTMTYDPGPDFGRRKSAFVGGYGNCESEMTVIHHNHIQPEFGSMKQNQDSLLHKHWGSTHVVKVYREPHESLGISIVGGKVDVQNEKQKFALMGIFVKSITSRSPAGKTGQFKTGDRILEVSGVDLRDATHERAVEAIRNAPNPVVFLVQSLIPWIDGKNENSLTNEKESASSSPVSQKSLANHDGLVNDIGEDDTKTVSFNTEPSKPELKKPIVADDSGSEGDDDELDAIELEGRTVSAKGQQIDRASAANIRRSKDDIAADKEDEDDFGYTTNKVKKKYGNLGHNILMVQLERGSSGLGLSLAGHRDRSCMAVFVCGLNPNGSAFKTGGIEVGDEILEVNGVVLHGRCHLNASAIIKSLSGPVFKVIILRRKAAIDDIAVKPITQFPVSLAEETSEEHFAASYPNVRSVAIKKTNQSLGIMIIEGKHAEVGQGIFISDIQEGSSAEKAGLEIGEMILAVNKDSLVGSNYDTAANLLKRTEGLVTLVVSKPGKKDQSRLLTLTPANSVADGKGLKPTTPSRPTTPVPEPPADPLTCQIIPGRDTVIEIPTNNQSLGINFVGGKDTLVNDAIIVTDVYQNGAAEKDGRLQPGDQILDVNGVSLRDSTNTAACQALRQTLPKMKITVLRPCNLEYTTIEVDLAKKPGKGLGLSIVGRKKGKGVYIADIIPGTSAELDGRITKGDILVSVNGQSVAEATSEEAGAILKTATGRVALKLHRYKPSTTKQ